MADENPLEAFRLALAGATRAIAGDAEVELSFTSDIPTVAGKSVKAPLPGRTLGPDEAAQARGFADAAALRLRHHDPAVHRRGHPPTMPRAPCSTRPSRRGSRRWARGRWTACVPISRG